MAEKQVKILRSIGTAAGVLRTGAVVTCDEGTADSWVELGFAEHYEAKQAPQDGIETPEDNAPALEVAVDGPDETKDEAPADDKEEAVAEEQEEAPADDKEEAPAEPKKTRGKAK